KLRIIELVNDIRPDDPELRRAMGNKGCNVEGAHADQGDMRLVRPEHEGAAPGIEEIRRRLDPDAREQRQRLVEDSSFWDSKDDRFGHKRRAFKRQREKGQ